MAVGLDGSSITNRADFITKNNEILPDEVMRFVNNEKANSADAMSMPSVH
jgi:hypothetical protein